METHYPIRGNLVTAYIHEGLACIVNDDALKRVVGAEPTKSVSSLVRQIKADYIIRFGKQLAIEEHSFAIEILGHVYFERFLRRHRRILRWVLFWGLYDRFCRSCVVIDCGERGKDPNRFFWDALSVFYRNASK